MNIVETGNCSRFYATRRHDSETRDQGRYDVTGPIGAGGMGEVYKATDRRLDRIVAIKVLPAHLAESPERKERFEREARTISKLNHPNICTLYDVGSQGGTDFLVMEYIEGETLADRLKRGTLTRDEALGYAVQITDALTKAHRAGIVHRDLKPGNIMLTKEGVKLLDFGLAKLVASDSSSDDSDAPTMQQDLTRERAVIGTPRYMAPEQLEGGAVDARTDVYAFGLVLRQMLPNESDDAERVVTKCLVNDPDERWQTAKDLGDELRWMRTGPRNVVQPSSDSRARVAAAILGLLLLASIGSWSLRREESVDPVSPMHFRMQVPGSGFRLTDYSNPLVISRDGSTVVLKVNGADGNTRIYRRSMNIVDATLIEGTERASVPVLSWDGDALAFTVSPEMRRVPLSGGVATKITDRPRLASGIAWGPDGSLVLASRDLLRVSGDGGPMEPLLHVPDGSARWPQFLPDGKTLLFTRRTPEGHFPALLSLENGEHWILEELGSGRGVRYVPPRYLVWCEGGELFAASFDLDQLEVRGASVSVWKGVHSAPESLLAYFTTSDTGTLLYLTADDRMRDWRVVLVDRRGGSTPMFEDRGHFRFPRFSPRRAKGCGCAKGG